MLSGPPKGDNPPTSRILPGSVHTWPCSSVPQPSGTDCSFLRATSTYNTKIIVYHNLNTVYTSVSKATCVTTWTSLPHINIVFIIYYYMTLTLYFLLQYMRASHSPWQKHKYFNSTWYYILPQYLRITHGDWMLT